VREKNSTTSDATMAATTTGPKNSAAKLRRTASSAKTAAPSGAKYDAAMPAAIPHPANSPSRSKGTPIVRAKRAPKLAAM